MNTSRTWPAKCLHRESPEQIGQTPPRSLRRARRAVGCLTFWTIASAPLDAAVLLPVELTCEYATDPLGIDTTHPRFSWVLQSSQRGQMQSAYQILVASAEQKLAAGIGDKWDSGKVTSEQSVNVVYRGSPLASGERCYWKARCWDRGDRAGPYSRPAWFEMGLLRQEDWSGKWIGMNTPGSLPFVSGRLGQAVLLDGRSQTVRIPHYARLKPGAQITIAAWIKPAECTDQWRHIYRKEDGDARHLLAIGKDAGFFGLWLGLGIGGAYKECGAPLASQRLLDGQWHFVAATYDGSAMRLYADGKEIGSRPETGHIDTAGTSPAYVGSYENVKDFFPGGIDDVRIYERALSAGEIQARTDANRDAPDAGLVGWWKLNGDFANSTGDNAGEALSRAGPGQGPAPLLRRSFQIAKPVKRARAYVSGLGWCEFLINGRKVSDRALDPAVTDYCKRVLYASYDITDRLAQGANVVGVALGNGWYSNRKHFTEFGKWGDSPRLLLQLNVDFTDGGTMSIASDETWKASTGPFLRDDLYGGETYDARLEKPGWATIAYDDSAWGHAVAKRPPGGIPQSQLMPPIKAIDVMKPANLTNPKPGIYVYDMGQLFGGWARLRVKGSAGTKVNIQYAERVLDSGLADQGMCCYPGLKSTDDYILKGDPQGEVYAPTFTFHPVRYVQIEGYPGTPTLGDLQGVVVHGAEDLTGDFHCSNELLNQIHRNAGWSLRNALYGMPMDCLHREPIAYIYVSGVFSALNARKHMPLFWSKWLRDVSDSQDEKGSISAIVPCYSVHVFDAAFGGIYPVLVWYCHQYYGDDRILSEHYAGMKKWVDYLTSLAPNHILSKGTYGDHMVPGKSPGKEEYISKETPPPLIWTAYYYLDVSVMAQAAGVLGKTADARHYAKLAEDINQAFNKQWFNRETSQYAGGSQTANLIPLAIGLVRQANRDAVVKNVARSIVEKHQGRFHTGDIGTTCMLDRLPELGQGELMYKIATATTYPGWGYMVKEGATTIWESWGRSWPGNPRERHESMLMLGVIEKFFYTDLAGIQGPAFHATRYMAPGFREICIRPRVLGDLEDAAASIKTVRGMVSSSWKRTGHSISLDVGIPVNSQARVSVPKLGLRNVAVEEGGNVVWRNGSYLAGTDGIVGGGESTDYVTFDVGSGSYAFVLTGEQEPRVVSPDPKP